MKRRRNTAILSVWIFLFFLFSPRLFGQTGQTDVETLKKDAPKVFIDCETCDLEYIRSEINFVSFSADRAEAQVQVFITSQKIESSATEYTVSFQGQKEFAGNNDTLKFLANEKDSRDESKKGLVRTLKMGLMRYVSKTPICSQISVEFMEKVKPTAVVDKWNFWVFSVSADSFLNGEKSYNYRMFFGSFSARRITPEWKISISLNAMYNKSEFSLEDQNYVSTSDSQSIRGMVVKSINDHWSIGAYLSAYSSTYQNIRFGIFPAPAIEYDLFPYSQSTKKQLRFLYKIGFNPVGYRKETIYDKKSENLWNEELEVTLELKQKWGTISTSLEGSHYFHDFSKSRLELSGEISVRLFKGLSFNIHGSGSRIHDQLSLPKGGASLEEILLQRRQLETSFQYFFSVGLSYTFGSIYSNVVNPRFGTGGGGISINIGM